jgi:hypothetical protein
MRGTRRTTPCHDQCMCIIIACACCILPQRRTNVPTTCGKSRDVFGSSRGSGRGRGARHTGVAASQDHHLRLVRSRHGLCVREENELKGVPDEWRRLSTLVPGIDEEAPLGGRSIFQRNHLRPTGSGLDSLPKSCMPVADYGAARLGLEVSAEWARLSSSGLWGADALLSSTDAAGSRQVNPHLKCPVPSATAGGDAAHAGFPAARVPRGAQGAERRHAGACAGAAAGERRRVGRGERPTGRTAGRECGGGCHTARPDLP